MRVIVIGTGLIGTSIALALREQGSKVWLTDADPPPPGSPPTWAPGELLPEEPPQAPSTWP